MAFDIKYLPRATVKAQVLATSLQSLLRMLRGIRS